MILQRFNNRPFKGVYSILQLLSFGHWLNNNNVEGMDLERWIDIQTRAIEIMNEKNLVQIATIMADINNLSESL